jgi:hypothetical protein
LLVVCPSPACCVLAAAADGIGGALRLLPRHRRSIDVVPGAWWQAGGGSVAARIRSAEHPPDSRRAERSIGPVRTTSATGHLCP